MKKKTDPELLTSYKKYLDDMSRFTVTSSTTMPFTKSMSYVGTGASSSGSYPFIATHPGFPPSGVTTSPPPTKSLQEKQLEVAERIATALESIVERFC